MDRFLAVSTFAKVVELGSFARAAERLGLSTSAVSRQVSELEAHLNARLLNRTTRRLSLTESGQAFYEHSVQVLADLDEAEASVRVAASEAKGTLRLTCGVSFGLRYLAPALAEFSALHPGLLLDLDLSDRAVDLVEEGFDVAIRIGNIGSQGMVSKRIGWTQIVCCAAPAYLEQRREPIATPADLARHECLSYTNVGLPNVWTFEGWTVASSASRCGCRRGTAPTTARCWPRWRSRGWASCSSPTSSSRARSALGSWSAFCPAIGRHGRRSRPSIRAGATCPPRCAHSSSSSPRVSSTTRSGVSSSDRPRAINTPGPAPRRPGPATAARRNSASACR